MRVLISLHDVTPFHRERLERAEALLAGAGVEQVTYLLVPNFHGLAPIANNSSFTHWVRRSRRFSVHWALHGYYHREFGPATHAFSVSDQLKRLLLTDREGEFLALRGTDLQDRLTRGRAAFTAVVGEPPVTFVAPAWLCHDALFPCLRQHGIRYTEDHRRVYDLDQKTECRCPVITWATRTRLRRLASPLVCETLVERWRHEPAIRIALHPFDFEHDEIVRSIQRVLDAAVRTRQAITPTDLI